MADSHFNQKLRRILEDHGPSSPVEAAKERQELLSQQGENHWSWRLKMAEQIAAELDPDQFGVKAVYVFGSVKNATAGPGSDIDLLIHFGGTERQRSDLMLWLSGWSLCLAQMNYLAIGYRSEGLLDIHLITDKDIECRTSFAVKIDAVTDAARQLPLKQPSKVT